jgi:hypothetical protein
MHGGPAGCVHTFIYTKVTVSSGVLLTLQRNSVNEFVSAQVLVPTFAYKTLYLGKTSGTGTTRVFDGGVVRALFGIQKWCYATKNKILQNRS